MSNYINYYDELTGDAANDIDADLKRQCWIAVKPKSLGEVQTDLVTYEDALEYLVKLFDKDLDAIQVEVTHYSGDSEYGTLDDYRYNVGLMADSILYSFDIDNKNTIAEDSILDLFMQLVKVANKRGDVKMAYGLTEQDTLNELKRR